MDRNASLDPVTLRQLAAEYDEQVDAIARECPCHTHKLIMSFCAGRAASYRTRAIQIEQARAEVMGFSTRNPRASAPGLVVEQVPRDAVLGRRRIASPICPVCGGSLRDHNMTDHPREQWPT